jgi:hypothetical protein
MSNLAVGLGYVEIGICEACAKPDHLFVSSVLGAGQFARCIPCVVGASIRASYDPPYETDHLYRLNAEVYPVLHSEDICQGCLRPEIAGDTRWQFSGPAVYLKDQLTQVRVHNNCSMYNCHNCSVLYATTAFRGFRGFDQLNCQESDYLNTDKFVTFENIEGNHYCDNCKENYMDLRGGEDQFTYCRNCEATVHVNNTMSYDHTTYCDTCYDDNVYSCDECSESYWDGDGHECEYDSDSDVIHNYSYKPSPQFFGTGRYHLGLELEVEARDESRREGASLVQELLGGRAYMKDDGSLSDGFEIVTHPHTLEEYQQKVDWTFLSRLRRRGYRSWDTSTCGIHVHVSRCAFGDEGDIWNRRLASSERSRLILRKQSHELRFMKLIYDNQRQVERIAGRSSSYATFHDKGELVAKIKYGNQNNGRYSAVNTENDSTIEVRVFRGSLRKERVLSAIEFVTASVEYTRNLKVTSKNHALSWLGLSSYVMSNIDQYPNLATIMSESFANETVPEQGEN